MCFSIAHIIMFHFLALGYSTHTLGVKSNCRLRYIPNIPQMSFTLEVIPALPTLQVNFRLEKFQLIYLFYFLVLSWLICFAVVFIHDS